MSSRYTCPNDSEVLHITLDASTNPPTESYICPFCHYKSTKSNAISKLTVVDESYIPPSKTAPKKK
jgi:hypothetical protein